MRPKKYRKYSPEFRCKVLNSDDPWRFVADFLPESTLRSWLRQRPVQVLDGRNHGSRIALLREEIAFLREEIKHLESERIKTPQATQVPKGKGKLTSREIKRIKYYLTSKRYAKFGIRTLARLATRKGDVCCSEQTWHRYKKILEVERQRVGLPRKYKIRLGIRAETVGKIWHADTTFYRAGSTKYAITFVVDNYSKKILGLKVAKELRSSFVVEALDKAVESCAEATSQQTILITDQGSEHRTNLFKQFVSKTSFEHKFSRKDVGANCCVEAVFKQLKQRALRRLKPKNLKNVRQVVTRFVEEYNYRIPHNALKGATPHEVHGGLAPAEMGKFLSFLRNDAQQQRRAV